MQLIIGIVKEHTTRYYISFFYVVPHSYSEQACGPMYFMNIYKILASTQTHLVTPTTSLRKYPFQWLLLMKA